MESPGNEARSVLVFPGPTMEGPGNEARSVLVLFPGPTMEGPGNEARSVLVFPGPPWRDLGMRLGQC